MKNSLQLNVAQPCHENWTAMTPQEQGRFCGSCNKMVVDFSVMTDRQILEHFSSYTGSTCGRFTNDQLNRPITPEVQKSKGWFRYALGFMLPALLVANKSYTQGTPRVKEKVCAPTQTDPKNAKEDKNNKQVPKLRLRETNIKGEIRMILGGFGIQSIKPDSLPVPKAVPEILMGKPSFEVVKDTLPAAEEVRIDTAVMGDTIINTVIGEIEVPDTSIDTSDVIFSLDTLEVTTLEFTTLGFYVEGIVIEEAPVFTQFKRFVADSLTGNSMKLYPNPVRQGGTINVSYKLSKGNYFIQVVDVNGRVMQQESISIANDVFNIPLRLQNHLAKGQYILVIASDKRKKIGSKPFIVL
ncbi:MAG: T9SS type A sorting domain-containing protein [Chitinophagaceae bacterium]